MKTNIDKYFFNQFIWIPPKLFKNKKWVHLCLFANSKESKYYINSELKMTLLNKDQK